MKDATKGSGKAGQNQGEGDKESARRYNQSQTKFVNSDAGKRAIGQAGEVDEREEAALEKAEDAGKSRAKGEDPAVKRDHPAR